MIRFFSILLAFICYSISSPLATGQGARELRSGEYVDDFFIAPHLPVYWTFDAKAGETILIHATMMRNGAKPWAILYSPAGTIAATNHYNGGDEATIITHTATQTGTYSLKCWTQGLNETGDYRLGLALSHSPFVVQDQGGTAHSGIKINAALERADIDIWDIEIKAGEEFFIRAAAVGTNAVRPRIWLCAPNGRLVLTNDYNGGDIETTLIHRATNSGKFLLVVSPHFAGEDGSYRLSAALSRGPFEIADEGGVLTGNSFRAGTLEAADIDIYAFPAAFGTTINITASMVGNGAKPWVRLYNPDGSLAQSGHFNGGDTVDFVSHQVTQAGTFIAVVSSWTGFGNYSLQFSFIPPPLPPVVFVPAIAGSRLTGGAHTGQPGNGSYLWPTVRPDKIDALNLTTGAGDVAAVDVVRYFDLEEDIGLPLPIPPLPVYGPFLEYLQASGFVPYDLNEDPTRLLGNHLLAQTWINKPNLFVFPYDWRRDNAEHTALLNSYIASIRQLHNGAKVHIIAHSMGGLVARRYLLDYGSANVASVTTVGSPVWGAPQAIFRLLTGSFFGPDYLSVIDWINHDQLKAALWSMPSVAQLLPVNHYLLFSGGVVFGENGWDFNNNGDDHELYNPLDYAKMMTVEAAAQNATFNPIIVNQLFNLPPQTDWSDLPQSLPVLLVSGEKRKYGIFFSTTYAVMARSGPWWQSANPGGINANIFEYERLDPVYGPGDGTVPHLSALRLDPFLPPNLQRKHVTGDSEADHMGLLVENAEVWLAIKNFILTGIAGNSALGSRRDDSVSALSAPAELTSIVIKGRSFVNIKDQAGNQNTRLSPAAVLRVPAVDTVYGKNSLRIEFPAAEELTTGSDTNNDTTPIEIEIFRLLVSDTNRIADALERFRFVGHPNAWQLVSKTNGHSLIVDTDSDGLFEPNEAILPVYSGSGTNLDVVPPVVGLDLALLSGVLIVSLDVTNPSDGTNIFYSLNSGPVEHYSAPLHLDGSLSATLRVFAADSAGNTSGLIETSLNPSLDSTLSSNTNGLRITWPVADAYALEFSQTPTGPWEKYEGPISRFSTKRSVEVPTDAPKQFWRLRSLRVER